MTKHVALVVLLGLVTVTANAIHAAEQDADAKNPSVAKSADELTLRAAKKKDTSTNREPAKTTESALTPPVVRSAVLPKVLASELASAPIEIASGFFVNKIVVENQTVIPPDELASIVAPYEQRTVSADELQDLRHRLSQHYLEKGYVNSGVVLPDQQIVDGLVVMRAVEGELNKIEIAGSENLSAAYIEDQIRLGAKQPLNLAQLTQSLRSFEQNPSIEDIDAQLLPMANYGESLLKVRIKERKPYALGIIVNNNRSPVIGQEQVRLQAAYRNGLRSGDEISGEFGVTRGANEYLLRYNVPVPYRQLKFDVYAAQTAAAVVKENLDIRSESTVRGFGLLAPIFMTHEQELSVSTRFDAKVNKTYLENMLVPFLAGADDGVNRDSVFSGAVNWNRHWDKKILSVTSGVKIGVDMLDATVTDNGVDGRFGAVFAQTQYLQQVDTRVGYGAARLSLQYSPSSLLAMEKMALGGVNTVRGYLENQWLGDNGVNAVLEWHYPYNASVGALTGVRLDLIPFIDYGSVWDNDSPDAVKHVSSIGGAVKAQILKNLTADFSWGFLLPPGDKVDNGYYGINLGFQYRYPG